MLDLGRKMAWLYTIHFALEKMCERICLLREQYKDKTDMERIVYPLEYQLQTRYQSCVQNEIFQLNDEGTQFKVNRMNKEFSRVSITHRLDIDKKTCTCGEWQDFGVPCVDAMSYYFLKENLTLEEIIDRHVNKLFKFEMQIGCFKENLDPVILELIPRDGETLPPEPLAKKSAGRPTQKRMRRRSKFEAKDESDRKCSICKQKGHYYTTCPTLEENDGKKKKETKKRKKQESTESTEGTKKKRRWPAKKEIGSAEIVSGKTVLLDQTETQTKIDVDTKNESQTKSETKI
jgi:hypothetical protein